MHKHVLISITAHCMLSKGHWVLLAAHLYTCSFVFSYSSSGLLFQTLSWLGCKVYFKNKSHLRRFSLASLSLSLAPRRLFQGRPVGHLQGTARVVVCVHDSSNCTEQSPRPLLLCLQTCSSRAQPTSSANNLPLCPFYHTTFIQLNLWLRAPFHGCVKENINIFPS